MDTGHLHVLHLYTYDLIFGFLDSFARKQHFYFFYTSLTYIVSISFPKVRQIQQRV